MKLKIFILLIFTLVLINGCFSNNTLEDVVNTDEVNKIPAVESSSEVDKTFALTGKSFRFYMNGQESPDLKVKEGDKVRIEFTSEQSFHDFMIKEFNAATKQVSAGSTSSVEFIADKKGTFEYYCSIGSHRQMGMKGRFIVE